MGGMSALPHGPPVPAAVEHAAWGCELGAPSPSLLGTLTGLKHLDLRFNGIGVARAAALRQVMGHLMGLRMELH